MSINNFNKVLVLAILPKISSTLSLCGSLWIIIEIVTKYRRSPERITTYHRLLFCMSTYDILESIWNFAATWPINRTIDLSSNRGSSDYIPKELQETESNFAKFLYYPVGNDVSCSIQGFFLQLGAAIPICTLNFRGR